MSELYDIVQSYMDERDRSAAWVARRIDAAPQTVSSWKGRGLRALPDKRLLVALARLTHHSYGDVLRAALLDCGYLPEEAEQVGSIRAQAGAPDIEITADLDECGEGTVRARSRSRSRDVPRVVTGA